MKELSVGGKLVLVSLSVFDEVEVVWKGNTVDIEFNFRVDRGQLLV